MSFVLELVLQAILEIVGQAFLELVLKPLHWLAWATGVALCLAVSLGRFQIEPLFAGDQWVPEEGRPILYTVQATIAGIAVWILLGAVVFRQYFL